MPETAASRSTAIAPALTVLGFDYGRCKVGVAVGNTLTGSARALCAIEYRSLDSLFEPIGRLISEWSPAELVVGQPLDESGQAMTVTREARRFANRLQGRFGLSVRLVDERYSSVAAQSELRSRREPMSIDEPEAGLTGARQARRALATGADDAQAAAIILRQYLSGRSLPDHGTP